MKRWLMAGALLAGLVAAPLRAQENYKLKGRVNITNKCSKDAIPDKVRVSISIQFNGEDKGGKEVIEPPNKSFVVDFPKTPAVRTWKIVDVRRMDKTPICSCICCDKVKDADNNVMKCQWTPEASEGVPPDNDEDLVIDVTCECRKFVPDK